MNDEVASIFIYTIVPVIFCGFIVVICIIIIDRSRDDEEMHMIPTSKYITHSTMIRKPETVIVMDPQSHLCLGIKQVEFPGRQGHDPNHSIP